MSEPNKEQIKQVIMGFTEMFKGITGYQDLKLSDELVEKYGLHELNEENKGAIRNDRERKKDDDDTCRHYPRGNQ